MAAASRWFPSNNFFHIASFPSQRPKRHLPGSRGSGRRASEENERRIQQKKDPSESCSPPVCVMYNACGRVCSNQQDGVVRWPTGSSRTSAPRQANVPPPTNIKLFWDPSVPLPKNKVCATASAPRTFPNVFKVGDGCVKLLAFLISPECGFTQPLHEYQRFLDSSPCSRKGPECEWSAAISVLPRLSARPCLFHIRLPSRSLIAASHC